jgi:error-prone DNA polymerase
MRQADAEKIIAARVHGPFTSLSDFVQRTKLSRSSVVRLARADTFASLGLTRREALWLAMKIAPETPSLFTSTAETCSAHCRAGQSSHLNIKDQSFEKSLLPPMSMAEEVVADYSMLGLSLKAHPLRLLRSELDRLHVIPAIKLKDIPDGHPVRVAGIVLVRQRPSTARGITFMTLEDETGMINLIIRPDVWHRWRLVALNAPLVLAVGRLQKQSGVIHVVVIRLEDLSSKLAGLEGQSRDFC